MGARFDVPTRAAFVLLIAVTCLPAAASAQETTFRAGLLAGVATVDDEAPLALAGSFGYRFVPGLWLETELTWIGEGPFDSGNLAIPGPLPTPSPASSPAGADGVIPSGETTPVPTVTERPTFVGTLGLRWELTRSGRFRPYLAGALGLHHTVERLRIEDDPELLVSESAVTGSSFTAGGGSSVRLASSTWVDVDATYLRLSGGRNLLRLGGGISIRF